MAQFLPHRIEHGLPLRGEAAQDQHCFGGDGVDDLTNLLIVEQQIDELRHFQIVHGDHRFIGRRDDQIRLLRSNEVDIPRRNSIDLTPCEIRSLEVCLHQEGSLEVRPGEVRPGEVRPGEVRPAEVRPVEVRPGEGRPGKVRPGEVRPVERSP